MHSRHASLAFAVAFVTACAPAGSKGDDKATALVGGTLIDPGSPAVPDAVIIMRGTRIDCVGTREACSIPSDAEVVDVAGSYVMPGLIDAHVHYSQTGWVDGRPDTYDLRAEFPYDSVVEKLRRNPEIFHRTWLCSGVTSVFDVGGFPWTVDMAKATPEATDAPRVLAAGPLLTTVDHWVNQSNMRQFLHMQNDSVTRSIVREHASLGTGAIKVWYIDTTDSTRTAHRAVLKAASEEAARAKLPLFVHATDLQGAKDAIEAGARVLVHSVDTDTIDAEFVAMARDLSVIVIPTLTVLEGYLDVIFGRSPQPRYSLGCVDSATRAKLERALPEEWRQRAIKYVEAGGWGADGPRMAENLRRLHAAGVSIAVGSDAGNPGTAHGPAIFREMSAMQEAGLRPEDVLNSATRIAARVLGVEEETGALRAGLRADLLVLDADPRIDVANVQRARLIVRNGTVHSRASLLPAGGAAPAAVSGGT